MAYNFYGKSKLDRIVDVACGTGDLMIDWENVATTNGIEIDEIIGIDPSVGMMEVGKTKIPHRTFIEAGAELIFIPSATEMYTSINYVYVDVNKLGDNLCGAARPGHFRGVCTVVAKLFNIVIPDRAYFGEKDAQQLAIIKRMVQDLNFDIEIVPCTTVRESDGLAKSSRNSFLSSQERQAAAIIYKSLKFARQMLFQGQINAEVIKQLIVDKISGEPLARISYVEIVDAYTLKPVSNITTPTLIAVAVYIGKTRLIDNFSITSNLES
jgi:pantoate--beta-alanine ligase